MYIYIYIYIYIYTYTLYICTYIIYMYIMLCIINETVEKISVVAEFSYFTLVKN